MKSCSINELFLLDDVEFYPLNNVEVLAFNKRNNKKIIVGSDDLENAGLCSHFFTLEQHVKNIKLNRPDVSKVEIENSLNKMLASGLMISPDDFLKDRSLNNSDVSRTKKLPEKWVLAICSADRPALISRLLSTITPHITDISVKPLILMIDDSRDIKSNIHYSQTIKNFCKRHNLEYEFWGREERKKFCEDLGLRLPKCKTSIQHLLSPDEHPLEKNTIGQVRNFAVLRSAGKSLLMVDDDCLINPLEEESYESVSTLGHSGRRGHVEASYDELFIKFKKSLINPFEEHLNVLGSTFQSIVSECELSNPYYWIGKSRNVLFEIGKENKIYCSVNSIAGALNSRQMDWFYQLTGADLQQGISVLETLDNNEEISIDQATWNGRYYDEVSRSSPFIGTTICGIAPLELTPPMPPIDRNEDLALGAFMNFLYENSLQYQFGWGLPHLPDPLRTWHPFKEQSEPKFNATSFFILLSQNLADKCPYTKPEDRLRFLSEYMSKMPEDEINSLMKDLEYGHRTTSIYKIEKSKEEANTSPIYQQGCNKMMGFHLNKMKKIPEDISQIINEVTLLSKPFSQALHDWPKIWSHCKNEENLWS